MWIGRAVQGKPAMMVVALLLTLVGCRSSNLPSARSSVGAVSPRDAALRSRLVRDALRLEGRSYRWGGSGPRRFDCSGLIWFVYDNAELAIPRTAAAQAIAGTWVPPDELLPGDLVFFGPRRDRIDHVGLVVSPVGEALVMVHSTTSRGVVRTEVWKSDYWSRRIRFGRRLVPADSRRATLAARPGP